MLRDEPRAHRYTLGGVISPRLPPFITPAHGPEHIGFQGAPVGLCALRVLALQAVELLAHVVQVGQDVLAPLAHV